MAASRAHATEFSSFTGNDLHPPQGPFGPRSDAGYAPPGAHPSISPPGDGVGLYIGYGYTYPPSSKSGYNPSAVAAKAFKSTPPGYDPPQASPVHGGFPPPGHERTQRGTVEKEDVEEVPVIVPLLHQSESTIRTCSVLMPPPSQNRSDPRICPRRPSPRPISSLAPSYLPQPIQPPPPQLPSSTLGLSFTPA